jgi:hypothetical protein
MYWRRMHKFAPLYQRRRLFGVKFYVTIVLFGELGRAEMELEFVLRPTASRPVPLAIGLPFGAHDQILSFFPFDKYFVVLPRAPSLTRGRVCNLQCNHWGPITIHYRTIWDCVPSSSPLTARRDCGGGIPTRLHTGETTIAYLKALLRMRLTETKPQSVSRQKLWRSVDEDQAH